MMTERNTVVDDRGRELRVPRLAVFQLRTLSQSDRSREVFLQIQQKSSRSVVVSESVCLLLLSIPFLAGGIALFIEGSAFSRSFAVALAVIGSLLFIACVTRPCTIRSELNRLRGEYAGLRAKQMQCLACNYELVGVPPEPDGCTVCPECGAAWRLGTDE